MSAETGVPVDESVASPCPLLSFDAGLSIGVTDHGRSFSAAVARANVFATQFHPEKSAAAGLELYERFVQEVRAA